MVETSRARASFRSYQALLPCDGVGITVTPAPLSVIATRWFQNVHWLRRTLRSENTKACHSEFFMKVRTGPMRAWRPPSGELCVLDAHGVRLLPLSCELDVTRATHVSTAHGGKKDGDVWRPSARTSMREDTTMSSSCSICWPTNRWLHRNVYIETTEETETGQQLQVAVPTPARPGQKMDVHIPPKGDSVKSVQRKQQGISALA